VKEKLSFSTENVLDFIQQSIKSSQISVDKTQFRNDLTQSTCMLVLDGLEYTFSHRSFQEFFAAYFLARVKADEFERVLPQLVRRGAFDNVLTMVSEMNKEKFEETWALPTLNILCESVKNIDPVKNCLGYAIALFDATPELMVDGPGRADAPLIIIFKPKTIGAEKIDKQSKTDGPVRDMSEQSLARSALYNVYGIFDKIHARLKTVKLADGEIRRKIESGESFANDSRFNFFRSPATDRASRKPVTLTEKDSGWLTGAYFEKFLEVESEILPKI
jgi:hypothetical protein